jgi:predicted dehydrogenase
MEKLQEPVRIAIIGPGRMGRIYARAAHELASCSLIAISGRSEETTLDLARSYGVPGYPAVAYREMLAAHPEIEAVVVATSEWAHLEPVLACLEAGKHVALEKPMATSPADAVQMRRQAEAAGVKFMICHSIRFDPRYALMQQQVAQGMIGEVLNMHGRRHAAPRAIERVYGRFPLAYWLIVHDIDMMLWLTGSAVTRVRAFSGAAGRGRHDFIVANLVFASGAVGIVECSWGSPPQSGRPQNELFTVRGSAGVVEVLGHEHGLAVYAADGAVSYPDTIHAPVVHGQQEGSFRAVLRHFAGGVRDHWPLLITGQDGLAVVEVAAAIDRSLKEDREVALV